MPSAGTEKRERILAVAARLFHEQGFEATGVATILRAAGVNSGSLYHFFSSKEALLAAVLERHMDELRSTYLDPAEAAASDPIERVFALLDLYRRGLQVTNCTRGSLIGNLALEVGDRKPQVRALIDGNFALWSGRVLEWLNAAGSRLPAGLDRRALSRFILTVMEGAVMQARAAGSLEPFDACVGQLRSYLQLLTEEARRERGAVGTVTNGVEVPAPEAADEPDRTEWRAW